jgi:iron complex outermembrane receptor protein
VTVSAAENFSEPAGPGPSPGRRPSSRTTNLTRPGRPRVAAAVLLLLAGLAPATSLADPAAPAEATLVAAVVSDTLVVRGRSVADGVLPASPGVVTVVDLEEEKGGADLAELLARVAGLQVRRYGGLGAEAVPSIRGSTGAQVQVLVDDLPLADAQRGAVDIALLPLERYGQAEIHRGVVPAGFGGVGAAGAINLRTRERADGAEARVFTGSFGDLGGRVSQAFRGDEGARRGLLLVHGRRIDNRYEYLDHHQTLHDTGDDVLRTRENADFAQWGVLGQGELRGDLGLARASAGYFRRDGGRPGPLGFPSPHARIRHERADARAGLLTLGQALAVDLAAVRREDWLFDPEREVGADPYDRTRAVSDDLLGRVVWTPRWDFDGALALALTAGGALHGQWYRETNDGDDAPQRHRRTVTSFIGASLEWLRPRLSLRPAWRWQRVRDDFPPVPPLPWLPEEENVVHEQDAVSPSVGIGWQVVADRLLVQAHWFESVRQPTWVELFGQPGGLAGNRELVPEEIAGRDLGLQWTPTTDLALRATWFLHRTEQTIIYHWAGLGISRPENIGRSRNEGVELEAYWRQGPVDLTANLTWQDPRDAGGLDPTYEGKRLPYLSDREAFASLRWRLGAWRPGAAVIHQSENYRTRYNREIDRAPARTLLNLELAYAWAHGTITGEVLNLTDNDVYDVEGYPLPGRSVRLALHWHGRGRP